MFYSSTTWIILAVVLDRVSQDLMWTCGLSSSRGQLNTFLLYKEADSTSILVYLEDQLYLLSSLEESCEVYMADLYLQTQLRADHKSKLNSKPLVDLQKHFFKTCCHRTLRIEYEDLNSN